MNELWEEKEIEMLRDMCKPLIEYLNERHDPHTSIVVNGNEIKIVHDMLGIPIDDANDVRGVKG